MSRSMRAPGIDERAYVHRVYLPRLRSKYANQRHREADVANVQTHAGIFLFCRREKRKRNCKVSFLILEPPRSHRTAPRLALRPM
ncbi:hypothetical protein X777_11028 [Ooceraea biroi]|uniref:Uncharacterized protein n=1 Tax=Ooceraea biroi TaxID=2015173 RepID=A0A026W3P2_OOCBI|nr:hypothetical protein X777_11028 [Ooceraea biroi]